MLTMLRLILFLLLPLAVALGQETPVPSPTPTPSATPEASPVPSPEIVAESTPSPTPEATPELTPTPAAAGEVSSSEIAAPSPESSPSAEASPVAEASPEPSPAAPGEDVIPLPGEALPTAVDGAPLDTEPIVSDEAPSDNALIDPNSLMPDEPPALPAVNNEAEKQRALAVRYVEVRTQVEKDPKVASLKEQADKAKSDEGKRAAMREYYRLLFKKMVVLDSSLESKCKDMENAYIRRLAQTRLEPTIPLNPPPTPEPIN